MVGWVVGTLTSVAGVIASYAWDLPTGATIISVFGSVLLLLSAIRFFFRLGRFII